MACTFANMKRMIIIQVFLLFMLSSCGINKSVSDSPKTENTHESIIYQDFKAKRTESNAHISELKIEEFEGKIKQLSANADKFNNPVEVIFLDKSENQILKTFIEHPIVAEYEYSSPSGELSKTIQILDSADFFIRYNRNPEIKSVWFKSQPGCQIFIDQVIKLNK